MNIVRHFKMDCSKKEITSMFAQIDLNGDGKLSFEEFLAWYRVGRSTKSVAALRRKLFLDEQARTLSERM